MQRDKYVEEQFDKWDLNHDDMISIDEFYLFFYSDLCFKFPLLRTGVNPGARGGHRVVGGRRGPWGVDSETCSRALGREMWERVLRTST